MIVRVGKCAATSLTILALGLGLLLLAACNLGMPRASGGRVEITRVPEVAKRHTSARSRSKSLAQLATETPSSDGKRDRGLARFRPTYRDSAAKQHAISPTIVNILDPLPNGTVIRGSRSIFGSAVHPGFLQYRLEYASQPNPQNLWYPVTGAAHEPAATCLCWAYGIPARETYQMVIINFD